MRRSARRSGQAAVEAMFAIPVLLIFFLLGLQLFTIAFNAQYVNTKARYKLMAQVNHASCPQAAKTASATVQTNAMDFGMPGQRYIQSRTGGAFTQKSTATIVCQ